MARCSGRNMSQTRVVQGSWRLDVDMVVVGGGAAAQQLAAGALNIGYSGFPDFVRAINQGAPIKIVMTRSAPLGATLGQRSRKCQTSEVSRLENFSVACKDITLIYMGQSSSQQEGQADVDFHYAKATPQFRVARCCDPLSTSNISSRCTGFH